MTSIVERVEAGARWLDGHRPGWVDRIDLDTLDLGDPCRCVLGQEFGEDADTLNNGGGGWVTGYCVGLNHLLDGSNVFDRAVDLGMYELKNDRYSALTNAWRELIERRRAT